MTKQALVEQYLNLVNWGGNVHDARVLLRMAQKCVKGDKVIQERRIAEMDELISITSHVLENLENDMDEQVNRLVEECDMTEI